MVMKKEAKPQESYSNIFSSLGSLALPIILVLFLLFSLFFFFPLSESSSLFLLTIPIALLSTLFLVTLRKKKGSEDENLIQENMQKEELQTEITQINKQEAESQSDSSFPSDSESSNGSAVDEKFELNVKNSSLPSDSESINGSILGERVELDQNSTRILGIYESLASDNDDDDEEEEEEEEEDGLIEINLPSSHFCGLTKKHDQKSESKLPDFLPEAMFKQEGLMELLAEINEMNEDENLIEIDISMGSSNTTCQDLRLKQEMPFTGDPCGVLSD